MYFLKEKKIPPDFVAPASAAQKAATAPAEPRQHIGVFGNQRRHSTRPNTPLHAILVFLLLPYVSVLILASVLLGSLCPGCFEIISDALPPQARLSFSSSSRMGYLSHLHPGGYMWFICFLSSTRETQQCTINARQEVRDRVRHLGLVFFLLSLNWIRGIEEASSEIPPTAFWFSQHHKALASTFVFFPFQPWITVFTND
jgi:hypothetical protein